MHEMLKQYIVLVRFLGAALGPDYEVVLHDLTGSENAVIAIANGQISGREVGAPLTNMALRFLADQEYLRSDFKAGYQGLAQGTAKTRSSTMFLKDRTGQLVGMLCINHDPSHCIQAANAVLALGGLAPLPESGPVAGQTPEKLLGSMPAVVRSSIEDALGGAPLPPSRLTMEEKVRIVQHLNENGVFYLKGAVSEVAAQLGSSEATIYRYLSKLKG